MSIVSLAIESPFLKVTGPPIGNLFLLDRLFAYAVTTKEGIPVFMGKVTSLPNA